MKQLAEYIAFDLEFHKVEKNYELIQVSAVKMVDGEEVAHFDSFVYTDKPLKSYINGLTGITSDKLLKAPTVDVVLAEFTTFVGETPLIGYSARQSDLPILLNHGLDLTEQYAVDVFDEATARRSKDLNSISKMSLQSVARFLGITGRGHNSLEDARMTAKVYEKFVEFDSNRALLSQQESVVNTPFAGLDLSSLFKE